MSIWHCPSCTGVWTQRGVIWSCVQPHPEQEDLPDFSKWSNETLKWLEEILKKWPEEMRPENVWETLRRIEQVMDERKRRMS